MNEKLRKLKENVSVSLAKLSDLNAIRDLEVRILGRKGELTEILRGLASLSEEERKVLGKEANEVKQELAAKFEAAKEASNKTAAKRIDPTLPGEKLPMGHLHPITIIQNDLEDFFTSLGFAVVDGPELESDYYNFEALNIPPHHPARDMQDTFYIDMKNKEGEYDMVMRTHTSPVQVRAMQKFGAPLRCIMPGKCFRSEATDVRHEHTFYQIEGLMVGEAISLADLKGVLEATAKHLYGPETRVRMRPKFYPFVEPGVNGEVSCFVCKGSGCKLCKQTGWLEVFGAGTVHPNVLKAGGIDPAKYQGFAFGFGLNRLVMIKYGIEDIRLFNSGDLRFLDQF